MTDGMLEDDEAASRPPNGSNGALGIEVSFVMPCLNEVETLEGCIKAARKCIADHGLQAEVIVADNGSSDGSQELATRCGARVVVVTDKGYGAALTGGFAAARGRYLVMGDADQSYDFGEAFGMIEKLRSGADVVMGSRILGRIEKGAMPWSHRWIGNPVLSFLGRALFRSKISDFHCGLRALTRESYERLDLRTTGMEFASELVVKASASRMRIEEIPITLYPDQRSRPPHLRTWRDGWRHLRFMLTLSPRYTLFLPGLMLMTVGGALLIRLYQGPLAIGPVVLDIHSMQLASLFVIVGYQAMTTAIAARIFAVSEEIGPSAPWMQRAFKIFTLERGLSAGLLVSLAGVAFIGVAVRSWAELDFGPLEPSTTMRPVSLGATLIALGMQTLLMSFLYSMLGIRRRRPGRSA
ncbi:MAG: glycosyltransferase family 2 protein [Myxococcales bacterium]